MKQSVTKKELQTFRANYASGVSSIDQRISELTSEVERLRKDRTATAGALHAVDKLLESLVAKDVKSPSKP